MKVTFLEPRRELKPYIESLWVFESAAGMPATDQSMAAPNGCPKLVIPYRNSLRSIANGRSHTNREQHLYFIGNRDSSTLIKSSPEETGFIGIEFRPHGAFPIFGIPMREMANAQFEAESVFGNWGRDVREALRNLRGVPAKLDFIQGQLVALLRRNGMDNRLVDFCVQSLKESGGRMPIKELEQKTGFTRRYLDTLFSRHVGFPPKTLAGIFRFQRFYAKWAGGAEFDALKEELFDYYFDQAHFTKEFRKMTGYSPRRFVAEVGNEFGRRLTLR